MPWSPTRGRCRRVRRTQGPTWRLLEEQEGRRRTDERPEGASPLGVTPSSLSHLPLFSGSLILFTPTIPRHVFRSRPPPLLWSNWFVVDTRSGTRVVTRRNYTILRVSEDSSIYEKMSSPLCVNLSKSMDEFQYIEFSSSLHWTTSLSPFPSVSTPPLHLWGVGLILLLLFRSFG